MAGRERNLRRKAVSEEPEEEDAAGNPDGAAATINKDKLLETRQLQQLRKRRIGVGSDKLAQGLRDDSPGPAGPVEADGLHGKVMDAYVKAKATVTTQDEDPHMAKYIEEQLALRLGKSASQREEEENDPEYKRQKLEAELYMVPEDFRSVVEPEVALPGMSATLTEVPLTAKDKLKSIEQTEALKRRMLARVGVGTLVLEEVLEARAKETGKVQRGEFASTFGRHQPYSKKNLEKEDLEAELKRRKFMGDPALKGGGRRGGRP